MAAYSIDFPASAALGYDADKLAKLKHVLAKFDVSIAEPEEMMELSKYEIVMIVDDSGSMRFPAEEEDFDKHSLPRQKDIKTRDQLDKAFARCEELEKKGEIKSRWAELKETIGLLVDVGGVFDDSGIDCFFLNRPAVMNVTSSEEPNFQEMFRRPPIGGTPLTQVLTKVATEYVSEKPVLLVILTDGVPDGGAAAFCEVVGKIVRQEACKTEIRIQIMACTGDETAIGWLDDLDKQYTEVDVTDDYFNEMVQILKKERTMKRFTRGDWVAKAMLGPILSKFDEYDEWQASNTL